MAAVHVQYLLHVCVHLMPECVMGHVHPDGHREVQHIMRVNMKIPVTHVTNLVRHIHLVGTHIPPVAMPITQTIVRIQRHVIHTVIPAVIPVAKARPQKPKVACHAVRIALHHAVNLVPHRVLRHVPHHAVSAAV